MPSNITIAFSLFVLSVAVIGGVLGMRKYTQHRLAITLLLIGFALALWAGFLPGIYKPVLRENPAGADQIVTTTNSVWNRYESELAELRWRKDANWYLYSTLRGLVIILGGLTPALILWIKSEESRGVTASVAAVVAISSGLISEFDFRGETARCAAARAALESEKARFVARAGQVYGPKPIEKTPSPNVPAPPKSKAELKEEQDRAYLAELATFADRIEIIVSEEESGRLAFLRGAKEGNTDAKTPAAQPAEPAGATSGKRK